METETKEKQEKYEIGEVATQTRPVIVNTETKQAYTELEALLKILKDVEELKNNIVAK